MNDCSAAGAAIESRRVNWRSRPEPDLVVLF